VVVAFFELKKEREHIYVFMRTSATSCTRGLGLGSWRIKYLVLVASG
jgi:hypothetical protein